ncbi:MAG: sulfatase [Planctomycetes bacterium]|nr:sulfatase [Planctomycetota bacterium]
MRLERRLLLVLSLACLTALPAAAADKPNVLMIAVDDLNDWVGCLGGHPQAKTPNIDRLASRGMLFANAHCQAPICNPSRVSLMTGRLPSTTGIYLLSPTQFRQSPALADCLTLPEYFAKHGYATFGGGKIYHNSTSMETFQEYGPRGGFGPLPKEKINYPTGHRLWDWGEFPESDDQTPDAQVADWAVERLRGKHDKPFFLAVGFFRPHVPLYAPKKWWDLYPPECDIELPKVLDGDRDDIPQYGKDLTAGFPAPRHAWFVENRQWRRAVRGYLACVSFVDHQIGRVLDALDQSPHGGNTIVALWGDHGWALGEKERWAKRALWQRETGVPLIVAAPGMARAVKTRKPAGLIDVYPTLVDLCGLPPNPRLEGASLAPLLKAPDMAWDRPTICTFWQNNHAVISQEWRYIRYADGSEELYRIQDDPREWNNLAGDLQYRDAIRRLAAHLPKINAEPLPDSRGLGSALQDVPD